MSKHQFEAVIFDLDGVITKTASVHSRAWKKMFDAYLKSREADHNEPFREFTSEDYLHYVDGKPRYNGVQSFLETRKIDLPYGSPDDSTEMETVCGLGNRKNDAFNEVLKSEGVEAYPSTVRLLEDLKRDGVRIGVASSSKNCEGVLNTAGLMHFVETRVDGVVSAETGLNGKPAPDIFLTAAKNLGVDPNKSIVVEDATSGVQAGRNGNFGLVLGLAREDNIEALKANGADIVVEDLEELTLDDINRWFAEGIEKDNWKLSYNDYDLKKERSREALMTVGNGFFGTRGAMEETRAGESNYPGTYIAGMYNRLVTPIAGHDIENEDFVNVPNWLGIRFSINGGEWLDPNKVVIERISRELNLKNGLLTKNMVICDNDGNRSLIVSERMASMANPQFAGMRYRITPMNFSGKLTISSVLDGTHINAGVKRYSTLNQKHLQTLEQGGEDNITFLKVKTTQSEIEIAEAARIGVKNNDVDIHSGFAIKESEGAVENLIEIDVQEGHTIELEKIVSIHTSQYGERDVELLALKDVERAPVFNEMLNDSTEEWSRIWDEIDIKVEGDRLSQKLLRLHNYHLIVSASPHNVELDASVTARGLHGEAYRGHIFWDELYILPYYNLHFPEVARSLLMYRFRRLEKARAYAKEYGFEGSMFPWQSGSDGREETQVLHLNPLSGEWGPDHSSLQRHVSLAIAFNVWGYFHATEDIGFMENYGAEMFMEICRFWSSIAEFDQATAKYSIAGVMGPDEFHEMYPDAEEGGLRDNAYTNIMVSWMFSRVPEILSKMTDDTRQKVADKIELKEEELKRWDDIQHKLKLVISEEGIISQYDGYFDLEELDWDYYRQKYGNIYRMDRLLKAEGKSADDYKVAKQADTLMTFYNLDKSQVDTILKEMDYNLPEVYLEKNLNYYLARTSHGSTLSRVVHAQLAEMIGDRDLSIELYLDALGSDYNDIQGGTTAEGIHAGVMAGTIMIAVSTYAGVDVRGDVLKINPALPDQWKKMNFTLRFKGVKYEVYLSNEIVQIKTDQDTEVIINNRNYRVTKNSLLEV